MKINNEIKVGLLFAVTLLLVIPGYYFLKGRPHFDGSFRVFVVFDNLQGLSKLNEVRVDGLVVGTVDNIEPVNSTISGLRVTLSLSTDVKIPVNSVAYIAPPFGGLGASSLVIEKGNATRFLSGGDTLATGTKGLPSGKSSPLNRQRLLRLGSIVDSVIKNIRERDSVVTTP